MKELAIHTPLGNPSVRMNVSHTRYHLCSNKDNFSNLETESSTATCTASGPSCGMLIHFGGVRGSGNICGPKFQKYGSATTSLLIEDCDHRAQIILDAGSGISRFYSLVNQDHFNCPTLLLLTHFHLDHLEGLPLLSPIYHSESGLSIAAVKQPNNPSAEEIIGKLISPPFWPVSPAKDLHYIQLDEDHFSPLSFGPFQIRWIPVLHPNGCTSFRIDHIPSETSFVFATDIEWKAMNFPLRERFMEFCVRPKHLSFLVMDGQFDDMEYEKFRGWGHSTWQDCIHVAKALKVSSLRITHHAPTSDDALLDIRQKFVSTLFSNAKFAQEGETIFLGKHCDE